VTTFNVALMQSRRAMARKKVDMAAVRNVD
jgi:hypothetical protein